MAVKRALITGITGQDGSYLTELLLGLNYELHGLYRSAEAPAQSPAIRRHHGAIEKYDAVAECVREVSPHECYHLAAQTFIGAGATNEAATLHTNVNGTWNVLAALREHAPECRLFVAGSSEMFGDVAQCPQAEDTPLQPNTIYGVSKVAGYHLMRYYRDTHGMHASCGILYNHESPRRRSHFVTRKVTTAAAAIKAGRQREVRLGNLDDVRDWGHAKDFVRAMWLMLQQDRPDDYVLATGVLHSVRELVRETFASVGLRWEDHVVVDPAYFRPPKPVPLAGDPAKARRQLGWRTEYDFASLIREMVEHDIREQGGEGKLMLATGTGTSRIEMYKQIEDCRLCHGVALTGVLDLGMQALTGVFPKSSSEDVPAGPLRLVKCGGCGLVQLEHNYDLSMLYGETYGYRSGLNASMVRHLRGRVADIERRISLADGDLVIDIGSNDGTLLGSYSNKRLQRVGIDPSGLKFRQYYQPGIDLIPEFFSAEAIRRHAGASKKAKVVTSIAMFYDLERPLDFVAQILDVLDDEGLWVFEQSYLPTMMETSSYDTVCHEHLEYYALKQIEFITQKHGLKIVNVELNPTNGGSFALTVAKRGSAFPEAKDLVDKMLAEEVATGYDTTRPFAELETTMREHRDKLVEFLRAQKQAGKRVFGYGASTKGNVLLQYCGIGPDLLPCIAEVNEDKFGAFTPGTRIPIVSEQDARRERPDYFMVLPWHFRDGIVAKEAEYLRDGGKLVFPLPKFEIVAG
jgi:GDP-mannose 4,6-dehydratase